MTHPKPLLTAMYFTDTHSKGVNPRSRIDDYPLAIIEKVDWVVQQSIKRKVDIILHGGDWFDSHDVGNSVVGDFMDAIAPAVAAGIPIVGTYGSHDVHGYNAETLKRGALRILESSKMVTILRRGQVYAINGVAIVGCPHTTGLDGGDGNYFIDDYYCVDQIAQEEYDATILLAHGTLVEYPLPDGFDHTLIENVKVNADLVLSGDYHEGYGVYRRSDGVVFCNPGSVARTKVTNKRIPCVAFVEVYAAGFDVDHGVSIIPIAKAKPFLALFLC